MKVNFLFLFLLITITFLLNSCFVYYGNDNQREFAKLSKEPCNEKPKNVAIYLEGEKIDFEYEKIGFVEALGNAEATNEDVINNLRYEAWSNCANAVINVKKSYIRREAGTLTTSRFYEDTYNANYFSGIAVKIKTDTNNIEADTSFVQIVIIKDKAHNEKSQDALNYSFFTFFTVIFGLIIYFVYK